jgi:CDP-glycerol glycerophosphotransferase (TagB/SpsB family)
MGSLLSEQRILFFHTKISNQSILKKVLFETHHLYYWPNFRPIIDEMIVRKNYNIEVSMPHRGLTTQQNILNNECARLSIPFITADTESNRIDKIRKKSFDIIIVGNVGKLNMIVNDKTIAIMVYHGIGLKQSYYNDTSSRINLRAIESLNRFNELRNKGHDNLILTGYTKLDRLFTISDKEINFLKNSLQLDKRNKTILYAPSFYPSSIEKISSHLSLLSQYYNIIIKLHGFSWEQKRYKYQSLLFTKMVEENQNINLIPNENFDIIPYYKIADILVSDISSTMFEYLPLNKPIIQAECYTLRLKHRIFPHRFWRRLDLKRLEDIDFVYKIHNAGDLFSRIYYALDNVEEMQEYREKASEYYLYKNDGKASYRLINALENYN